MQRVPAKAKAKPPPARFTWVPKHSKRLAGPRIGEVLPRRDHVLRLTYVAGGGWLLLLLLLTVIDAFPQDAPPRHLRALAAGAFVGWLAGRVQALWLWRGEVPAPIWAGYTALGWAAGAALLSGAYALSHSGESGLGLHDVGYAFALVVAGGAAGLVSGAQQARILRARGLDAGWWIGASTAATAIGWSIWAVLVLTVV